MGDSQSDGGGSPREKKRFEKHALSSMPGFWRQLQATLAASVAAFSAGNVGGWAASMVLVLTSHESPVGQLTTSETTYLLVFTQLSSIVNMMFCGFIMDKKGRKAGYRYINLLTPIGWVYLVTANNVTDLRIGAILTGTSAAAGLVIGVVYISEIATEKIRGHLVSILVFFYSCGILTSHTLGEVLSYTTFNSICLTASLISPLMSFSLPESPQFLILKSRQDEAKKAVEWFHGNDPQTVEDEMKKLELVKNKEDCGTFLASRANRKSLSIIVFSSSFAELTGTYCIETYSGVILKDAKQFLIEPSTCVLILSLFRFFAGLASVLIVEKCGRKPATITAFMVMGFSLVCLVGALASSHHDWHVNSATIFGILTLYTLANQIFLATSEVIIGEIASHDMKGVFMAIGGSFRVICTVLSLMLYSYFDTTTTDMQVNVNLNYAFEAGFCFLGAIVSFYFLPETRGKSYMDIVREMNGDIIPSQSA